MSITHETLNTGAKMPRVGLGTWKSEPGKVRAAVEAAIDAGYRHIDCALIYGNENEVGEGIETKIKEGVVKREDLFITTKLWLTFYKGKVEECMRASLKSLKLEYVDLYLMHWPFALDGGPEHNRFPLKDGKIVRDESIHYTDVWKEMEKLQDKGLTKAIGVSNFNVYQLKKLLEKARIVPAMNQYECHPYLGQEDLYSFCKSKGIATTAYSPFASPDRPKQDKSDPVLLDDPVLAEVGKKYNKTAAHVCLRYLMQRGFVVIPKSVTPARIHSNLQLFDFELSDEDFATVKALDRNWRALAFDLCDQHKYYPFQANYSE